MTKTQNYQLPQWVKEDRIMMDDFNEAMGNIESGLTAAKATADRAEGKADTLPFKVGTYKGNGGTKTIEVGFQPSLVIVAGDGRFSTYPGHSEELAEHFGVIGPSHTYGDSATLTSTGFTLKFNASDYPYLNDNGVTFCYIAFR